MSSSDTWYLVWCARIVTAYAARASSSASLSSQERPHEPPSVSAKMRQSVPMIRRGWAEGGVILGVEGGARSCEMSAQITATSPNCAQAERESRSQRVSGQGEGAGRRARGAHGGDAQPLLEVGAAEPHEGGALDVVLHEALQRGLRHAQLLQVRHDLLAVPLARLRLPLRLRLRPLALSLEPRRLELEAVVLDIVGAGGGVRARVELAVEPRARATARDELRHRELEESQRLCCLRRWSVRPTTGPPAAAVVALGRLISGRLSCSETPAEAL